MRHHIELLVFAAEGNIYGVHANQVETLLSQSFLYPGSAPFALPYKGRRVRIVRLAQYMRQQPIWRENAVADFPLSASPKRVLVTTDQRDDEYVGLLIQELQQLVSVSIEKLFPLPQIMEAKKWSRLIWGVALLHDSPVILLDLKQL
ncbi:chemotaxis signal transduction protein [Candidatus Moduliflexus flocculans]|uniref:Chemotaxis signal transduction protein n=1 Tax=Candidatus Moduliflexus flocculans TaxID=1499966 RepID=A0A081BM73_9BACT|nr:chemotaxis signal transduction protein [Candidatus Moduliflexus flocculans]